MRTDRGFTLVELLITVSIVGIVAAIAVPQLLRARLASNEAGAIAALRAVSSGQANYASTCGHGGYTVDLADLAKPPPGTVHGFISPDLAANGVAKSGYVYALAKNADPNVTDVIVPSCNAAGAPRATGFHASATPIAHGQTGTRFFAADTPGTIYVDTAAAVPNPIPAGAATLQ